MSCCKYNRQLDESSLLNAAELTSQVAITRYNALLLSLIHISEPTRQAEISYAVFCLKKKKEETEGKIYSPVGKFAERAKVALYSLH